MGNPGGMHCKAGSFSGFQVASAARPASDSGVYGVARAGVGPFKGQPDAENVRAQRGIGTARFTERTLRQTIALFHACLKGHLLAVRHDDGSRKHRSEPVAAHASVDAHPVAHRHHVAADPDAFHGVDGSELDLPLLDFAIIAGAVDKEAYVGIAPEDIGNLALDFAETVRRVPPRARVMRCCRSAYEHQQTNQIVTNHNSVPT